jgi:hypothetical protein
MLKNISNPTDIRHTLLSLLSTSGTLAGISLALVGIVNFKVHNTNVKTMADALFLFAAMGFVAVCYFIFFALRHTHSKYLRHWNNIIDILFLASLTLTLLAGFAVVYEFM